MTYVTYSSSAFRICGIQITPSDRLVSFDVTSLFTQVPIDEALRVVEEQLTKDQTLGERTNIPVSQLVKLVELCLRKTYFQFQEDFLEQTDGAAMGSPLSSQTCSWRTSSRELSSQHHSNPSFGSDM